MGHTDVGRQGVPAWLGRARLRATHKCTGVARRACMWGGRRAQRGDSVPCHALFMRDYTRDISFAWHGLW